MKITVVSLPELLSTNSSASPRPRAVSYTHLDVYKRQDKRRSNVWKLDTPAFSICPQCGELKAPHKVCGNCGYYKGREVIKKD